MRAALQEEGRTTTFAMLAAVALLFQLLLVAAITVRSAESYLRADAALHLEVIEEARDAAIQEFYVALTEFPAVERVEYVTKEQAYERTRLTNPDLVAFLEEFSLLNPFPDTFSVTLNSLDDYDAFAQFLQEERWSGVIDPSFLSNVTDQEQQVRELLGLTRAGKRAAFLLLFVGFAALLFVLTELMARRAAERAQELETASLLGSDPVDILTPFVAEATVLTWIAIGLSVFFLTLLLLMLPFLVPGLRYERALVAFREHADGRLWLSLLLGVFLEALLAPAVAAASVYIGIRPKVNPPPAV